MYLRKLSQIYIFIIQIVIYHYFNTGWDHGYGGSQAKDIYYMILIIIVNKHISGAFKMERLK